MGKVIALVKIMPKDASSFEDMKKKVVETIGEIQKTEEEYIAFGLKAFKITVVLPDDEGGTDALEEKLTNMDEVGSVEVEGVGRV